MPNRVAYSGKVGGLAGMLALLQTLVLAAGIFIQLSLGYRHLKIGLYLRALFGLQLNGYLLFAVVAMAGQVLLADNYLGYLAAFLVYLFTAYAGTLGVEHNMLVFGGTPGWRYTDMGGFRACIALLLWFKLYWVGWKLLVGAADAVLGARARGGV